MQGLGRIHPTHTDPRDGSVRYEYEYERHGSQVLLAAFEIKTGEVFGRVMPDRTGPTLMGFMDELAGRYPGEKIYVVWDNLNIHYDGKDKRLKKLNERHGGRFHFVYTPKHASWMNQIEIWLGLRDLEWVFGGSFGTTEIRDSLDQVVHLGPRDPRTARIRWFIWNHMKVLTWLPGEIRGRLDPLREGRHDALQCETEICTRSCLASPRRRDAAACVHRSRQHGRPAAESASDQINRADVVLASVGDADRRGSAALRRLPRQVTGGLARSSRPQVALHTRLARGCVVQLFSGYPGLQELV